MTDLTGCEPTYFVAHPDGRYSIASPQPSLRAGAAVPPDLPLILKHLAEWESKNGTLAAILPDEWMALMEPITKLAVQQSPRMAVVDLSAATGSPASGNSDTLLTDAYAEGRRDEQEELASVLPGVTYMDPPDGGAPTILEQWQRQAKDAARYLWLRNHGLKYANVGLGSDCEGRNVVDFSPTLTIPEPVGMSYEDNEWTLTDLDAAIDAAMSASTTQTQEPSND